MLGHWGWELKSKVSRVGLSPVLTSKPYLRVWCSWLCDIRSSCILGLSLPTWGCAFKIFGSKRTAMPVCRICFLFLKFLQLWLVNSPISSFPVEWRNQNWGFPSQSSSVSFCLLPGRQTCLACVLRRTGGSGSAQWQSASTCYPSSWRCRCVCGSWRNWRYGGPALSVCLCLSIWPAAFLL